MNVERAPRSLILDIYGPFAAQFDGWLAVTELVKLMGMLGVDEPIARSAISRMTRRHLLTMSKRHGLRGYGLTEDAARRFADAGALITGTFEPADPAQGWVVVAFSVPEEDRPKRHLIRSRFRWLGMGNLSGGVWIGPSRMYESVRTTVIALECEDYVDIFIADYKGLGELRDVVQRSWDLQSLAQSYQDFVDRHRPVLTELRSESTDAAAFVGYAEMVHDWRQFPYLDPGLPEELLPAEWPGTSARALFNDFRQEVLPLAMRFAESIVQARP